MERPLSFIESFCSRERGDLGWILLPGPEVPFAHLKVSYGTSDNPPEQYDRWHRMAVSAKIIPSSFPQAEACWVEFCLEAAPTDRIQSCFQLTVVVLLLYANESICLFNCHVTTLIATHHNDPREIGFYWPAGQEFVFSSQPSSRHSRS